MARVRLGRFEAEEGDLPGLCMRCGAPATLVRKRTFSWMPPWVGVLILAGLLPYVIVASVMTKRMRVHVPLCDAHKNHWVWRAWVTYGGLAVLGGLLILWIALMIALDRPGQRDRSDAVMGFSCVGLLIVGVAWLIVIVILQNSAIRPSEITERSITLIKVSERFAEAVRDEEEDEEGPYRDEERRRPPRRRRADTDQFYDPET
jgi:hypothetical protein